MYRIKCTKCGTVLFLSDKDLKATAINGELLSEEKTERKTIIHIRCKHRNKGEYCNTDNRIEI